MIKKFISSKYFFIVDLGLLGFIASNKQLFSHQNYEIRILLYLIFPFYLILVASLGSISKLKVGLITANLRTAVKQSLLPIVVLLGLLTLFRFVWPSLFNLGIHYNSINQVIYRQLAYVIISVPVQELIFRGYVISRLEQFSPNKYFLIFVSSLLFSAIHWPLSSLLISLGSFVFGLYLAFNFIQYRNLYLTMLIHSILGIIVLFYTVQIG